MTTRIEGIIPALITPFDGAGRVLEPSLCAIIDKCLSEGVHGFYVGGTTAEAFLLTVEERKRILEVVVEHVAGRVPVICHVGSISTDTACDLAKHAQAAGADAVSAIPPFYYRFSLEEIERYYLDIAASVSLPLILYNFPALSGVTLDPATAPRLFSNGRIVGIKHTSMDLYQLERMKRARPDFLVLNGHDEVLLGALSCGADGAIGSTYNFMGGLFVELREHVLANRLDDAQSCQREANDLIAVLKRVGLFGGVKHILTLQGIDCGHCRRPFMPLTDEGKVEIEAALERSERVRGLVFAGTVR